MGKLIVFEGTDGSGKSTQFSLLTRRLEAGERLVPQWCAQCMQGCRPSEIPFCITHALIQAVKGNREEGLFFSGASVGLLDRMCSVRELMEELTREWRALA